MTPVKTVNLSGFGGGYENVCQQMLWNGIKAVEERPEWAELAFKQMRGLKNVFGLVENNGPEAEELDKKLMEGVDDATGAMHHQVCLVLCFIAQNGREKWLEIISKDQPDRIFMWDGTEQSCPKGEMERTRH
jgi:hypothetical protein